MWFVTSHTLTDKNKCTGLCGWSDFQLEPCVLSGEAKSFDLNLSDGLFYLWHALTEIDSEYTYYCQCNCCADNQNVDIGFPLSGNSTKMRRKDGNSSGYSWLIWDSGQLLFFCFSSMFFPNCWMCQIWVCFQDW